MAKLPTEIEIAESVAHCRAYPLKAVIKLKGCYMSTGKLLTQATLHFASCEIEYFEVKEVEANVVLPAISRCPGCNSPLPTGSKSG